MTKYKQPGQSAQEAIDRYRSRLAEKGHDSTIGGRVMFEVYCDLVVRLYTFKAAHGLSLKRMVEDLRDRGISPNFSAGFLWRILNGDVLGLSFKSMYELCTYLEVKPSELIKAAEEKVSFSVSGKEHCASSEDVVHKLYGIISDIQRLDEMRD